MWDSGSGKSAASVVFPPARIAVALAVVGVRLVVVLIVVGLRLDQVAGLDVLDAFGTSVSLEVTRINQQIP